MGNEHSANEIRAGNFHIMKETRHIEMLLVIIA